MNTQRQPGYYWIKVNKQDFCAYFDTYWYFFAPGFGLQILDDSVPDEINETRIPEPGEKVELIEIMQELISKGIKFTYDPKEDNLTIFKPGEAQIVTDKVTAGFSFDTDNNPK